MKNTKAKHTFHKSKQPNMEPPVVELNSMVNPEKAKQVPGYTKLIEKVVYQRKSL